MLVWLDVVSINIDKIAPHLNDKTKQQINNIRNLILLKVVLCS